MSVRNVPTVRPPTAIPRFYFADESLYLAASHSLSLTPYDDPPVVVPNLVWLRRIRSLVNLSTGLQVLLEL